MLTVYDSYSCGTAEQICLSIEHMTVEIPGIVSGYTFNAVQGKCL